MGIVSSVFSRSQYLGQGKLNRGSLLKDKKFITSSVIYLTGVSLSFIGRGQKRKGIDRFNKGTLYSQYRINITNEGLGFTLVF